MNDMRRFFDARRLTEQQLGMVEFVLTSPAYEEAFRPYLEAVRDSMRSLWLDRSQKRKDEAPDDWLAGGVCAIEGLLAFFTAAIHESNFERMHEAMAQQTSEKQFETKRLTGQIKPVVGVNQSAEPQPYNPLDDL